MAGRNGFVICPLSIPFELRWLVEQYQSDMKIVSLNQAFRTLLETHPAIAGMAQRVYDGIVTVHEGGSP